MRLHSQFTRKAVQSLRFASGDEEIRAELYHRLSEPLFKDFTSVRSELEMMLREWGASDDEEDSENEEVRKRGLSEKRKKKLLDARSWERDARLFETGNALRHEIGETLFEDHNPFRDAVLLAVKQLGLRINPSDLKIILRAVSWRVETAPPVIDKIHKPSKVEPDPLRGRYEVILNGKASIVEYEPDSELRDSEQVPLLEPGGIEAFFRREVLPHVPDAWIDASATKIGYEISFTRYFYKPQPLRTLEEIRSDIEALEREGEGLLGQILVDVEGLG